MLHSSAPHLICCYSLTGIDFTNSFQIATQQNKTGKENKLMGKKFPPRRQDGDVMCTKRNSSSFLCSCTFLFISAGHPGFGLWWNIVLQRGKTVSSLKRLILKSLACETAKKIQVQKLVLRRKKQIGNIFIGRKTGHASRDHKRQIREAINEHIYS